MEDAPIFPKVMDSYGNVDVINICDLLEFLFPDYFDTGWMSLSFEEEGAVTRKWMEENDAYYYCKPREDFFVGEAVREAAAAEKYICVVEDMS